MVRAIVLSGQSTVRAVTSISIHLSLTASPVLYGSNSGLLARETSPEGDVGLPEACVVAGVGRSFRAFAGFPGASTKTLFQSIRMPVARLTTFLCSPVFLILLIELPILVF